MWVDKLSDEYNIDEIECMEEYLKDIKMFAPEKSTKLVIQ